MIKISKCDRECYCSSCGKLAVYKLALNDKRIIQPGSEALCNICLILLKIAIDKIIKKEEKMQKIKVKTEELRVKVIENKKKHEDLVKKATEGYLKAVEEELNKLLANVKEGKFENFQNLYKLQPPIDKIEEYDTALLMLNMSTEDEVELTQDDFMKLVQDKWSWTDQVLSNNTRYI